MCKLIDRWYLIIFLHEIIFEKSEKYIKLTFPGLFYKWK